MHNFLRIHGTAIFNEGQGTGEILIFAITRFTLAKNIVYVIPRTSRYRGSLYRGSTVLTIE